MRRRRRWWISAGYKVKIIMKDPKPKQVLKSMKYCLGGNLKHCNKEEEEEVVVKCMMSGEKRE